MQQNSQDPVKSTSSPLKIVFAGTPNFAVFALQALIDSSHQVIAVYTQPDKPSGRGLKLTASAVKELALAHQLALYQPASLKDENAQKTLAALNADVMVVAAYGLLLPASVLTMPSLGCINIHPSLLPRWRGAAPIQRSIYAGDEKTGVTIMQMDQGLDTGSILTQQEFSLTHKETSQTLHDKLAIMGAKQLIHTLDLLHANQINAQAQDNNLATYAQKISKEEARLDWNKSALVLDCEIRAFNPWPVAYTTWQEKNLRIWQAQPLPENSTLTPGSILRSSREGLDIATGKGVLRILQVQLPGGKVTAIADFYNAHQHQLTVGHYLV